MKKFKLIPLSHIHIFHCDTYFYSRNHIAAQELLRVYYADEFGEQLKIFNPVPKKSVPKLGYVIALYIVYEGHTFTKWFS